MLIIMSHIHSPEQYKHNTNQKISYQKWRETLRKYEMRLLYDRKRVFHPAAANWPLVLTVIMQTVSLFKPKIFKHSWTDQTSLLSMSDRVRGQQSTSFQKSWLENSGMINQSNSMHSVSWDSKIFKIDSRT